MSNVLSNPQQSLIASLIGKDDVFVNSNGDINTPQDILQSLGLPNENFSTSSYLNDVYNDLVKLDKLSKTNTSLLTGTAVLKSIYVNSIINIYLLINSNNSNSQSGIPDNGGQ